MIIQVPFVEQGSADLPTRELGKATSLLRKNLQTYYVLCMLLVSSTGWPSGLRVNASWYQMIKRKLYQLLSLFISSVDFDRVPTICWMLFQTLEI